MLLAVHTDKEFTYWLQRHAEEGWKLKENKGNTFVFTQKPYEGRRICSYTVNSDALGVSAEDAFYELQVDLRKIYTKECINSIAVITGTALKEGPLRPQIAFRSGKSD